MKKSNAIICFICAVSVFQSTQTALAQYTHGTTPNPPPVLVPGGLIAGPLIKNSGIVRPLENLDVFQYSNLGSNGSTFGEKVERRSNIEINRIVEINRVGGNKASNLLIEEQESAAETTQAQVEEEPTLKYIPLSPSGKTQIYVWTDESGVIHITNIIDSVPPEYRDKAKKGGR